MVEGVRRIGHWLRFRLHPTADCPYRPAEHRALQPLFLPIHLNRTHALARQVRGIKGLGRCVAIHEDRAIADRAAQHVGDRAEDRERILPEEKGRTRMIS
jgi:hypothetical protein